MLISTHHRDRGELGPSWRKAFVAFLCGLFLFLLFNSSAFAQVFPCSNTPRAIAVGDFNGDGKLDIAVVQQGSNSVFVYLGDGHGSLQAPVKIATGLPTNKVTSAQPTSVVAGDFTNGGKVDLAVAGFRTVGIAGDRRLALSVLKGDGSGGFATSQFIDLGSIPFLGGTLPTLVVGDLNGDGKQDLALVDGQTTVKIFLQNSGGGFSTSPSYETSLALSKPADVAVGDFNGDGKEDFAVAMRLNSVGSAPSQQAAMFFGNGAGGFTRQPDIQTGGDGPQSIVSGDFNHDSKLDLAVLHFNSADVSILLGDGHGNFVLSADSPIPLPTGDEVLPFLPRGASLLALDFNGDGKLDLVAATHGGHSDNNRVFILVGDGQGHFETAFDLDPGFPPRSIVAGDFNGDGLPDIAASFFCGTQVKILINPTPRKAMVYVTNREDDTVSVIDPDTNQVIDTVGVGHKPHGITLTPDSEEAYVVNRNDDNVSIIKTGTTAGSNTEILRIPVGQKPEGVRAANIPTKGTKVFVANRNDDTISVIDADPLSPFFHTVISTVSLPKPKSEKPIAIAFSPDGAFAYVAAEESNRLFVVNAKLAIEDPANAVLTSVSVGKKPVALDVSSDGKIIYVANRGDSTVSKLSTQTPSTPASPHVIATIKVAQHPEGVAALPDGRLYVTSREADRVSVIDTTGTVITSISAGKHPLGIGIHPGGGFTYAAEEGDDSVAVIDTSSNSVVAIIPVGKHPRGVATGTVPIVSP